MASNFNNDSFNTNGGGSNGVPEPSPLSPGPAAAMPDQPASGGANGALPASTDVTVSSANPESAAFVRFGSCRWQQPVDKETPGSVAFCTHREVKPYAGTAGFDANAWCTDCQYYKLRRAPKKRERTDDYGW